MDTLNTGIGGNNPPDDIAILRDRLRETHEPLLDRADELLAAEARLPEIKSDDDAGRVGDYIKLVSAATKNADAARVGAKEPHLAAGRAVDGFFKAIIDPLDALKIRVNRRLTAYLQAKEAAERRAREEEAARLRAEAERQARAAAEAERLNAHAAAEVAIDHAIATEAQAVIADKAATVKAAELSRVRGDVGAVSSLRTVWVGKIVDRNALDLRTLRPYLTEEALQKAINAAVKAGIREITGAKIYEETSATVR